MYINIYDIRTYIRKHIRAYMYRPCVKVCVHVHTKSVTSLAASHSVPHPRLLEDPQSSCTCTHSWSVACACICWFTYVLTRCLWFCWFTYIPGLVCTTYIYICIYIYIYIYIYINTPTPTHTYIHADLQALSACRMAPSYTLYYFSRMHKACIYIHTRRCIHTRVYWLTFRHSQPAPWLPDTLWHTRHACGARWAPKQTRRSGHKESARVYWACDARVCWVCDARVCWVCDALFKGLYTVIVQASCMW